MMTETVVNVQDSGNSNAAKNQNHGTRSGSLDWLKVNVDYFKTVPGIIKLVQLLFGIICMSLASAAGFGATHWFLIVVVVSFILTILWVLVYLFGVREAIPNFPINWILTELVNTGIAALCYAIAFICQLTAWAPYGSNSLRNGNIAAGVFGIFQTILYGFGTYLLYIESKRS